MSPGADGRFAHGKVILLGEHAVVHGHLALAAAIDRGVRAAARPADADRLHVTPWGVEVAADPDAEDPLSRAFAAVLETLPGGRPPLRVDARVELPGGAGLGCSAALGVAILAAATDAVGAPAGPAALAERSLAWERVFHGNPSGVDNATAAFGGVLAFRRGEAPTPIAPGRPLDLVVAHGGTASSTKAMVAGVAARLAAEPQAMGARLAHLGALAERGRGLLEDGDLRALGGVLDEAQGGLEAIGVGAPRLAALCRVARRAGAVGAKLTGAGGGGCIVALTDGPEAARAVADALAAGDPGEGADGAPAEAFTARVGA